MSGTRWVLAVVAAVAALAAVVTGAAIFAGGSPSRSSVVPGAAKVKAIGGPLLRDPNAVMLGGRAGDVLVGLAALPGRADVVAVRADSKQLRAADVHVVLAGRGLPTSACGRGCFAIEGPLLQGVPAVLRVGVAGHGAASFRLPARPPARALALYRTADAAMRRLRTVSYSESLSSGAAALRARFVLQAPDRLRYVTSAGDRAVAIGDRRWDWDNGHWQPSQTQKIPEPAYMWFAARSPRLLARRRGLDVIGVFRPDPSFPAWFRLFVDRSHHVVRAEMVAPAHFMVDRFSGFDAPVTINPPR